MSFFDSPLGERLSSSFDAGKPDDIAAVVKEVEAKVWTGDLGKDQVDEILEELQRHRQFPHVIGVADAATSTGAIGAAGRRRYCQILIETGALHAAELACQELLDLADNDKERGEALGLMGRLRKQRYVSGGRSDDLLAAIAAYRFAYEGGSDQPWHGVNLLALTARASRDGVRVPDAVDTAALTNTILEQVQQGDAEVRTIWERTTEIEALVALGDHAGAMEDAVAVAEQLAVSRSVRAFELESLRRQLIDIWQLEPYHPILVAIADQKLHLGARAHVELPESARQLEKIFGTALPVGYNHLMRGLQCAESVAKITD